MYGKPDGPGILNHLHCLTRISLPEVIAKEVNSHRDQALVDCCVSLLYPG